MTNTELLEGQRILIVDDEPDVLDTLEDLLPMCVITRATSFESAKELIESRYFDMAILDIMGVEGYELLKLCKAHDVIGVMLTAYAVTPEDIKYSFEEGAASFVPKEKMSEIALFLTDIYEARARGKHLWSRWFDRLAHYFERKFGPGWQKEHGIKVK